MRTEFSAYLTSLAILLSGGAASAAPPAATMTAPPIVQAAPAAAPADALENQTYILGASDVIEVSVLGQAEFTTRARIGEDGAIRVPFLGTVMAANKTINAFADDLAKALEAGGYYSHPIVKVDIISYGSRYVTVLGNVVNPGLVPVDRPYRLSEIIAKVGGIKDSGADYVIFRPRQGAERRISVRDLATGDLKDDPYVSPGDKIFSPEADLYYVSGQVKTPGVFPLQPNVTFRMAVSRGGGVTDAGSIKSLKVTRSGKTLQHVNLDDKVMPGDVIVVGERLF